MSQDATRAEASEPAAVSTEALRKAESYIEAEEGATNQHIGWPAGWRPRSAPALTKLGVPDFAAHRFIFYYAVLPEVSSPTALSPFAAAAITGADPYRTTLQSCKYAPRFWCRSCSYSTPWAGLMSSTPRRPA